MFGGVHLKFVFCRNDLWKLSKTSEGCFYWSKVEFQSHVNLPLPHCKHSGWKYAGCLCVFGGLTYQTASAEFLNDHIDFVGTVVHVNNQLVCYNPMSHSWTNPQCFGATPSPRFEHCTTTMMHRVWFYGGRESNLKYLDDLFELNTLSRTWTHIQTTIKPQARSAASLSAISDEPQLVLHGGFGTDFRDIWVLDLSSQTWTQHTVIAGHKCFNHIGSLGMNKCVIIIGGQSRFSPPECNCTFHVRFEPKSLQQLAMQMIYEHRTVLPWEYLPSKLVARLEISKNEFISS